MRPSVVLYRGPLASCNFACGYCPFAKRVDNAEALARDQAALSRFVAWVSRQSHEMQVFFTPWGEALVRRWYQEAFVALSQMSHITRVCAQTNLSWSQSWLDRCDRARVALWGTYHPGEVSHAKMLARVRRIRARDVRMSLGIVGMREHYAAAVAMREALDPSVYLWVNAYRGEPGYYTDEDVAKWSALDPLFSVNLTPYASAGRACHAGSDAITVDGEGVVRRCHFVPTVLGRIDDPTLFDSLSPTSCPNTTCRCHIGYVHMPELGLREVFEGGLIERIPSHFADRVLLQRDALQVTSRRSLLQVS
ncbi:MAG: STM4011 family radical SAM protein [Deltaproteobacteria bacterium]|nr:STM4011 family radical SAM protein [Deltaproteobacteria bacterium]